MPEAELQDGGGHEEHTFLLRVSHNTYSVTSLVFGVQLSYAHECVFLRCARRHTPAHHRNPTAQQTQTHTHSQSPIRL
eukprot:5427997-Prymnesium_polylepis.2